MKASLRRKLFLKTCRNSIALVNLSRLGKDSLARSFTIARGEFFPWRGARELRYGRLGFAYARETRASWRALVYWVEMYVSCQTPQLKYLSVSTRRDNVLVEALQVNIYLNAIAIFCIFVIFIDHRGVVRE